MSKLIYITSMSLDGYVEDAAGSIDWVDPSDAHDFITGIMQSVGTMLLGRRLYQTMAYWEAPLDEYPVEHREFARVWQNIGKLVFSRTLTAAPVGNARFEGALRPELIRKLKRDSDRDISIGGAQLAGVALKAALVDECHLFLNPVIVGGGKPAFPAGFRKKLEVIETRVFPTGVVYLHCSVS